MEIAPSIDPHMASRVTAILADVPDPEIPVVSVLDLGIVQALLSDSTGKTTVHITPTYTGCPATQMIEQSIRVALNRGGFPDIAIKTILSPAWSTDMITDEGRHKLQAYGIAPPPKGVSLASLRNEDIVVCPRCGSTNSHEVSRFGSTPCKALWQCDDCQEPFDRFKCH